jgi:DNA-binding HxlR family transcriptional regulator
MPIRRGYQQACGIAHGLDLVGDRWALLIARELLLGPKRFTDLRTGLPGASPNVLTARLQELTHAGVVQHRRLAPPAASWVYELTDWGRELEPILLAFGTWALGSVQLDTSAYVSLDSVMLTVRTYFRPGDGDERAGDAASAVTLRIALIDGDAERSFGVRLSGRGADVSHEPPPRPDATITSTTAALLAVLADPSRLSAALDTDLRIDGDAAAARRLLTGVVLPEHNRPEPTRAAQL